MRRTSVRMLLARRTSGVDSREECIREDVTSQEVTSQEVISGEDTSEVLRGGYGDFMETVSSEEVTSEEVTGEKVQ